MQIIEHPSPNYGERPCPVDLVVLHYTGMETGAEALERLCDRDPGVSAHYLVEEDGRTYRLVAEEKRAHHAGVSEWAGRVNVNDFSIGIEIVNPGHYWGYKDFPDPQMASVITLLRDICLRHVIPKTRVVGHSDITPGRKEDPGEKFPWDRLADAGLAVGYYKPAFGGAALAYDQALDALREIGYGFEITHPVAAILAFQRRFVPSQLGQGLDPLTRRAIGWAADQFLG